MTNPYRAMCAGYEPGDGSMDGAQLVDGEWWHPMFGCDSLQMVVDNARAADLLERPTPEPVPASERWPGGAWMPGTVSERWPLTGGGGGAWMPGTVEIVLVPARRPKPPTLKAQALNDLDNIQTHDQEGREIVNLSNIRRALEALPE